MIKGLTNAFSIQMVKTKHDFVANIIRIKEEEFNKLKKETKSYISHQDLANVLGVECNRENIELTIADSILVARLTGGRLPEGTTTLPDGFKLSYYIIEIKQE